MAAIKGVSLHLWSSSSSSCLVFPSPSHFVVETLLSVLGHHRGVGQAHHTLLQGARELAMDTPGVWQQVQETAVKVKAVENILVGKNNKVACKNVAINNPTEKTKKVKKGKKVTGNYYLCV